jgi:hypothetical protein
MKTLFLTLAASLFSIASVFAGPPSDAAKAYYGTLKAKDYPAAAKHFDPAALKTFREMLSFFNELPDDEATEVLAAFFGEGANKESVKKMSDTEFFAAFLKGVMEQASSSATSLCSAKCRKARMSSTWSPATRWAWANSRSSRWK